MSLLLSILHANALVFGSLPQSSYPYGAVLYEMKSSIDPSRRIHVAPTYKHVSKLARSQDKDGKTVTHCFMCKDDVLHQVVWQALASSNDKVMILSRFRKWYKMASNNTLGASLLLEEDDMHAWMCSFIFDVCDTM